MVISELVLLSVVYNTERTFQLFWLGKQKGNKDFQFSTNFLSLEKGVLTKAHFFSQQNNDEASILPY